MNVVALLALLACGDGATEPGTNAGPPAAMNVVSGQDQNGTVGTELSAPLVVRVTDAQGRPVQGQAVNFRVTAGGGGVFAGSANTNADGMAQERWTLGTVAADSQRLEARAVDASTGERLVPAAFRATAVAGAPKSISKVSGDGVQGTVGTPVTAPPQVRVADQYDNPVPGAEVTFEVTSGGGTITGATQTTNSSGIATVGSWTLGGVAGANTLMATVTGLTDSPVSFTATGTGNLGLATAPSSSAPNRIAFAQQPVVQIQAGNGNPVAVSGTVITASITSGGGTLGGTTTATTGSNGAATFTDLSIAGTIGTRTLTFSAPGLTSVTANVTLTAGTATTIVVNAGNNQTTFVLTAVPTAPTVKVSDADGNAVSGVNVTFSVASGGGSVTGANATTNSSGIAQVGSWTLGSTDGTNTLTATPAPLSGSPLSFSATGIRLQSITTSVLHTCAVRTGGAAYCWGLNSHGQLGDGTTTDRLNPVLVAGGLTFQSLTTGGEQTCGVTTNGSAYCWGYGFRGQLGDGTRTDRVIPAAVSGDLRFQSLTTASGAAGDYTCGLTTAGAAYCWGYGGDGQLGMGTTGADDLHLTPTAVVGGLTFQTLIARGNYTCGLTSSATYCWGIDRNGDLWGGGFSSSGGRYSPTAVAQGYTFIALSLASATCGLVSGGAAYCWGQGPLGDGTTTARNTPTAVSGGFQFVKLAERGFCGLTADDAAYCWGSNFYGQVGDGTATDRLVPVLVSGGLRFAALTASTVNTCGVTTGGAAYCWGRNNYGQLGDGTTVDRSIPVIVRWP